MGKKTIIITGSSRGIGFFLAKMFLKMGHQVIINGRNEDTLTIAYEKLRSISEEIIPCQGDVSHESTHHGLIKTSVERFDKIDIWINNAGIPQPYKNFKNIDTRDLEKLVNVNIIGTLLGSRIALEYFVKQKSGSLYNMEGFGSDGRMMPKLTLYGTSKRAVHYFTRSLKKELKNTEIILGSINPGMVRTEFIEINRSFDDEKEQKRYEKVVRILAEDPEKVSDFIGKKIINNRKKFNAVNYLSGWKLAGKIFRLAIN